MKLFSYIITHDTGFAPNPFWGFCTLANCKPVIRRTANVDDWIVGLNRKTEGNKLIYAMKVEEVIPFDKYYQDTRFAAKIPNYNKGTVVYKCGDNIYKPIPSGGFQQLRSMHSNGLNENPQTKVTDLGGKNVLVSKTYYYFGSSPIEIPRTLKELRVRRAHKNRFPPEIIFSFLTFISSLKPGIHAPPTSWPDNDVSWKKVIQ